MIWILSLAWPIIGAILFVLSLPLLLILGPACWAYVSTLRGDHGKSAPMGAFAMTLVYTLLVIKWVHSTGFLILFIIVIPWIIGRIMMEPSSP